MEHIVQRDGDQLFTTSEIIADRAEVEHRSVLQIIGKYEDDLAAFGPTAFEMRSQTRGGHPIRIAKLNEQQSTLVLTYLRNTDVVRKFKMDLVKAFYEMAQQLQQPLSEDQIVAQALQITSARIKELEPKAEAWDTLAGAKGDYSVEQAAKMLSRDDRILIGRNRLFTMMGDLGWTYRHGKRQSWHAYQPQVDNGRIVLRMSAAFQNQKTGEMELPAPTIRLTAKGVEALRVHLLKQVSA